MTKLYKALLNFKTKFNNQTEMEAKKIAKTFENWSFLERYQILKEIGSGSYGSVFKGVERKTGKIVAIKHMAKIFEDLIDGKRVLREIALLKNLSHTNIVHLKEIFVQNNDFEKFDEVCLVLEYAPTDLRKIIKSDKFLSLQQVLNITYQMFVGLNYLHSAGVWHRDLKPANVLLFENGKTKLCDFGLSRFVESVSDTRRKSLGKMGALGLRDLNIMISKLKLTKTEEFEDDGCSLPLKRQLTSHVVTRWYRAPELILIEKDYDSKIDVWSLGCILAELLQVMPQSGIDFIARRPFFPGSSCFPLSPDKNARIMECGFPVSNADQLLVIIDKMGTPTKRDLEFITDKNARNYIATLPFVNKKPLKDYYPWVATEVVDFLQGCLDFNPNNRKSLAECLDHPIFKDVRKVELETLVLGEKGFSQFEEAKFEDVIELRRLFAIEITK